MQGVDILTIVLASGAGSGVVVALLNLVKELFVGRKRQKREASFLAIQLVATLEDFVSKCVVRAWNDKMDFDEEHWDFDWRLPKLSPYPQNEGHWLSFYKRESRLAERVSLLPNKITSAERMSEFSQTREGNPVASIDENICLGWEVLQIAKDLRNTKLHGKEPMQLYGV